MINASKEFKEKLKNGANVVNYADFTLSDGTVLHLEPKDFMIGGCQIEDKTTDGKFGVGFSIGKTLTLRIANHNEQFSKYDFYSSTINLYVAILLDDSTIEKIRKGVYYTIVPETPGDVIEISAVDGMFKLDRDYSSSRTSYPATLQRIISDACLDCGIPIGFRQFDNMSYIVKEKPEQGTYRQIVSYACQIAGYNARIDNNGSMQLVWYNTSLLDAYNYKGGDFHNYPHDTVVNGGNFTNYGSNTILSGGSFADAMPEHIFRIKSINVHTDDVQITGVRVSGQEEKTVLFGEEGYLIEVKENPFANGKEQEIANYLGGRMVGMVFRPLSAEILNNPLYEPHDIVRASDAKGNVYYTVLNSVSYTIGSYTTVACEAEDPIRQGSTYVSAAAQAVVEARRDTEKQLTTYDKAVQNMNQLTANAMGLFTKSEKQSDGSSIFYQSTKPITVDANGKCHFEAGSTVYKKQGEGFFVSRDGGKTYSSGFDADGNAVLNVLYAIGISFDWAKGGTLTLGGENNQYGILILKNKKNWDVGIFDKDKVSIRSIGESAITVNNKVGYHFSKSMFTPKGLEFRGGYTNGKEDFLDVYIGGLEQTFSYHYDLSAGWSQIEILKKEVSLFSQGEVGIASIGVKNEDGNYTSKLEMKDGYAYMKNDLILKNIYAVHSSGYVDGIRIDLGAVSIGKINNFNENKYASWENLINGIYIKGTSGGSSDNVPIGYNVSVKGSFASTGRKSRIVKTKNYNERLLYCYEMPSPMFGDIGSGKTDENGICYIFIDDIFLETIDSNCQYHVFLQKCGQGDIWVEERAKNYFTVKGTPNLSFSWEVKAKQSGYEMERLEKFEGKTEEPLIDYEAEFDNYVKTFYAEVLNYDNGN